MVDTWWFIKGGMICSCFSVGGVLGSWFVKGGVVVSRLIGFGVA